MKRILFTLLAGSIGFTSKGQSAIGIIKDDIPQAEKLHIRHAKKLHIRHAKKLQIKHSKKLHIRHAKKLQIKHAKNYT